MTTPELIDYIKKATDAGMSRQDIEATLLQHDWSQSDIDEAYMEIAGGVPAPSAPTPEPEVAAQPAVEAKAQPLSQPAQDPYTEPIEGEDLSVSTEPKVEAKSNGFVGRYLKPETVKSTQPAEDPYTEPLGQPVNLNREVKPDSIETPKTEEPKLEAKPEPVDSKPAVINPRQEMAKMSAQKEGPIAGGSAMSDMQNKLAMGHAPGQTFSFQAKGSTSPASTQIGQSPAGMAGSMAMETSKPKKKSKLGLAIVIIVILLGLGVGAWFATAGFTKMPFASEVAQLSPRAELNQLLTTSSQAMAGQVISKEVSTTYTLEDRDAVDIFVNSVVPREDVMTEEDAESEGDEEEVEFLFDALVNVPLTDSRLLVVTNGVYDVARQAKQHTVALEYGENGRATADIRAVEGSIYLRPTLLPEMFDNSYSIQDEWYVVSAQMASQYLESEIPLPLLEEALMGDMLPEETLEMVLPLILREDVTSLTKDSTPEGMPLFRVSMAEGANVMADTTASLQNFEVVTDPDMTMVKSIMLSYDIPAKTGGAISVTSTIAMTPVVEPVNIMAPVPETDPGVDPEDQKTFIDLDEEFAKYQQLQKLSKIDAILMEFEFDAAEYFVDNKTFTGLCVDASSTTLTGELVKTDMSLAPSCGDADTSFAVFVAHESNGGTMYQCLDSTGFIGMVEAQPVGTSCTPAE